jgi:hypothetical protein
MSENAFINSENANPNYIEYQKDILEGIEAKPADDVLPPELFNAVKTGLQNQGETNVNIDGKDVYMYKSENDILTVRCSHSLKDELKELSGESKVLGFLARIFPETKIIDNYYYVDLVSGKAFDASILWTAPSSSKDPYSPDVGSVATFDPKIGVFACFRPNKSGGELIINSAKDNPKLEKKLRKEMSEDGIDLLERVALFHEAGHKFQFDQSAQGTGRKGSLMLIASLMEKYPLAEKFYNRKLELMKSMDEQKAVMVQQERNASAFALSVLHRLKLSGLDLTRDLTHEEVEASVEYGLRTYDKVFLRFNGNAFSKQERKLQREAGMYPAKQREFKKQMEEMGLKT